MQHKLRVKKKEFLDCIDRFKIHNCLPNLPGKEPLGSPCN